MSQQDEMSEDEFASVTPGQMLRDEFLAESRLSPSGLAKAVGISPNRIAEIVNCRKLDRDGVPTKAFVPSLFVRATVVSRPTADRTIVGAGLNAQIDQKLLEPWKLTSNFTGLTIN
jgi:hypothetical protein